LTGYHNPNHKFISFRPFYSPPFYIIQHKINIFFQLILLIYPYFKEQNTLITKKIIRKIERKELVKKEQQPLIKINRLFTITKTYSPSTSFARPFSKEFELRGRMGGRPKVNSKSIELALKMYEDKTCSVSEILKVTGISKVTLYKYIRQYNLLSWEYSLRTDHNA